MRTVLEHIPVPRVFNWRRALYVLRRGHGSGRGQCAIRLEAITAACSGVFAGLAVAGCLVSLCVGTGARVAESATSAGTESLFSLGAGSRALGMAGAFTAVSDDATGLYWNPAGLCDLAQTGLTGFHSTLFEGSSYDFFSVCHPTVRFGSLGFGFLRVGTDGIQTYDSRSTSLGEIGFSQTQMLFSYGRSLPFKAPFDVRLGASIKVVSQRMGDLSAQGAGLDLGAMYPFPYLKGLTLGVCLRDFPGAKLKLVDEVEQTPRSIRAGVSYRSALRNGQDAMVLGADFSLPENASAGLFVGGEYVVENMVGLRAGLKQGKLAAGAGVRWKTYSFDYCLSNTELGNLHQFSVSASFGVPVGEKKEREEREQAQALQALLDEENRNRVAAYVQLAANAEANGDYALAIEKWNMVLEYDPESAEARQNLETLKQALNRQTQEEALVVERQAKSRWLVELAKEYMAAGELNAAALTLTQAVQLDSVNAEAANTAAELDSLTASEVSSSVARARGLSASDQHLEAVLEWNKVLRLEPENAEARRGLDASVSALDGVERSLEEAKVRIEAMTEYTKAARAYERGDYTEAKSRIEDMLSLLPSDQDGRRLAEMINERLSPDVPKVEENIRNFYVEGMNYFNAGEYEKAIESWKKIMAVDPDNEIVAKNIEKAKARLSSGERKAQ
jgi:tetratricopeptide (TPR) repeat protein